MQVYVVQPFEAVGARKWRKGTPRRMESLPQAERLAADLSRACLGVVVLGVEVSEEVDYCGEPRVIASYGEVPSGDLAA